MALRGDAINMGSGRQPAREPPQAPQPGPAASKALSRAMGSRGSLLNQQYGNQLQAWQAEQDQGNPR